jgi:hypothetical protein
VDPLYFLLAPGNFGDDGVFTNARYSASDIRGIAKFAVGI